MKFRIAILACVGTLISLMIQSPPARAGDPTLPGGAGSPSNPTRVGTSLGPRAWIPPAARDSAGRTVLREELVAQARAIATLDPKPAIRFAGPPYLDSLPPSPTTLLPDSLKYRMSWVVIGDVDGDGLADVASVEQYDSALVIRRNLGAGMYAPPTRYALADGAYALVLADLDGDGHPDVAVSNIAYRTHAYSVLHNRGDGTFDARADGDLSQISLGLEAADIGQDGRADLMFHLFDWPSVDIVRSLSDGTLAPAMNLSADPGEFGHETGAAFGDLDGDHNPDIVILHNQGDCYFYPQCITASIFFGRIDGTFEAPVNYQGFDTDAPQNIGSVKIVDVDRDGLSDLVTSLQVWDGQPPARPALLRNAGGRRFEAPAVRWLQRAPIELAPARTGPSGPPDLVYSNQFEVAMLPNLGHGTFGDEVQIANGVLIAATDLDGDGLSDLIVARSDTTEVLLANGAGGFRAPHELVFGHCLAAADFNGDHRPDLAVIRPGGSIGVLMGDGTGGFGPPLDFGGAGDVGLVPLAADLDGDGLADIASIRQTVSTDNDKYRLEDSLVVLWNVGGHFADPVLYDFGSGDPCNSAGYGSCRRYPMDMKVGDFDGDGRMDLALLLGNGGSGETGDLTTLPGLGNRGFGPSTPFLAASEDPQRLTVADFDGDGRDDAAVVCEMTDWNGRFVVFGGDPTEMLHYVAGPSWLGGYAMEHYGLSIAAADFDGDGRVDLAVGTGNVNRPDVGSILVVPNISPPSGITPTLASLASFSAGPGAVSLLWDLGGATASSLTIERQTASSGWLSLGAAIADGAGHAHYLDATVQAGARYGYRLRITSAGRVTTTAETWIDVPASLGFALEGARPNPTSGPLTIGFSLPTSERAALELFDIAGRRVRSHRIESPTPGRQSLALASGGALAPGLYFVRLSQGRHSAEARVAVVR